MYSSMDYRIKEKKCKKCGCTIVVRERYSNYMGWVDDDKRDGYCFDCKKDDANDTQT